VRNLFEDPLVVGAQEKLASEIAGAFRGHPALAGWAIGRGMTTAGGPSSREAWIHWLSVMSQAFQQASVPVFVGLDAGDVIRNSRMGPDELARLGLSALVSDNWRPEWARNVEAWPAFLAAYTSALAGSPALLEVAAGDAAQQVRSLEGTWRNGGMGAVSPPLLDFLPSLAAVAPFAERPDLLTSGLLDLERRPKEEGLVWLGFGRREHRSLPSRILVADPERREHDPEQGARESFEDFSR
jgi:hypothetical protein